MTSTEISNQLQWDNSFSWFITMQFNFILIYWNDIRSFIATFKSWKKNWCYQLHLCSVILRECQYQNDIYKCFIPFYLMILFMTSESNHCEVATTPLTSLSSSFQTIHNNQLFNRHIYLLKMIHDTSSNQSSNILLIYG